MGVFLGVTNQKAILNVKAGEHSFWCVYGKYPVKAHDLLLMYKSTYGIAQIYEIIGQPYKEGGHFMCALRDMLTINTVLRTTLQTPITAADLKADPILSEWGAIRRNFQQTTFALSNLEWKALKQMIIAKNPQTSSTLT